MKNGVYQFEMKLKSIFLTWFYDELYDAFEKFYCDFQKIIYEIASLDKEDNELASIVEREDLKNEIAILIHKESKL